VYYIIKNKIINRIIWKRKYFKAVVIDEDELFEDGSVAQGQNQFQAAL
jgi:hypothetical protein